jgi:hypothetical protein
MGTRHARGSVAALTVAMAVTGVLAGCSAADEDPAPSTAPPPATSATGGLNPVLAPDTPAPLAAGATTEDAGASPSAAAEPAVPSVPPLTGDPGRVLTPVQARVALLQAADLPDGWRVRTPDPESARDRSDPARCEKIFTVLRTGTGRKARAEGSYRSPSGVSLSQTVTSFAKPNPNMLRTLAATTRACPRFAQVNAKGERTPITAQVMPFPALGGKTLALRLTATAGTTTVTVDAVYVVVGHNQVSFVASALAPPARAELEALARKGMARLGVRAGTAV